MNQARKARQFLSLHSGKELLLLPNIWNPIGARILEKRGYSAAATASAAISASMGYEDGEQIRFSTLLWIVRRIARSVTIPVTADIETGYAETLEQLDETVTQLVEAGVAGINIEDGFGYHGTLRDRDDQARRISRVRETAGKHGLHLFINARVDTFVSGSYPNTSAMIEETVQRALAYSEAGADCIYPIGTGNIEILKELRERIALPLNVLAMPETPPIPVLQEIGINRLSLGPFMFRTCLRTLIDIADRLKERRGYESFAEKMLTREEVSTYLARGKEHEGKDQ